ncbi:MAG: NAD(P)/FAD-dependent oxidoreductase [Solirubrobacteraceae bacterium]
MNRDAVIIGAGIIGCAAAYYLALEGVGVTVMDPEGIAAGASGRNNGLVEHPYDLATEELFYESVEILGGVMGERFPRAPVGTMLVSLGEAQARALPGFYCRFPRLGARLLDPREAQAAEPLLGEGVWGCMLDTGHPVSPAVVTGRFAQLARRAGARFVLGKAVELVRHGEQVIGARSDGVAYLAGAVVVSAGFRTPQVLRGIVAPDLVTPLWGVIVRVELPRRPRHPLIEGALATAHGRGDVVEAPFTLLDSPSWLAVGSTMLDGERPDGNQWAPRLLARGTRFVPSIARASVGEAMVCARPRAFDNRPVLGRAPGQEHVWVASGHGGRGMSVGPASARMLARAILAGSDAAIPDQLSAARLPA